MVSGGGAVTYFVAFLQGFEECRGAGLDLDLGVGLELRFVDRFPVVFDHAAAPDDLFEESAELGCAGGEATEFECLESHDVLQATEFFPVV